MVVESLPSSVVYAMESAVDKPIALMLLGQQRNSSMKVVVSTTALLMNGMRLVAHAFAFFPLGEQHAVFVGTVVVNPLTLFFADADPPT